ncbi:hypothetical protein BDD43_0574 [Mucilaginibacter gracilis]|uniref:Uncharacterized protein n=2 Tax=Mucilaginibacter TaxID=423349 RepID=H1YI88_9SPHI|nr:MULTISPECIES: hypothetical protein [Mucilaginibacter]EHQ26523.1 hypothetical protein Mucpa_2396 [Mucilaginibacter paludis DSM 18603]RKR80461.1 hypothetical protein BDD43_0574 [Mucilaginibacter gracilis]
MLVATSSKASIVPPNGSNYVQSGETTDFEKNMDEHLGRADVSPVYKDAEQTLGTLRPINVRIDEQYLFEADLDNTSAIG